MPQYRIVVLEKFLHKSTYTVTAESSDKAIANILKGNEAYEKTSIEEGGDEWVGLLEIKEVSHETI